MLKLIRQLVQKLKKATKAETQHPSSHSNGNTNVVGSKVKIYKLPSLDNNDPDIWMPLDRDDIGIF